MLKAFRLFGIDVYLHFSWFFIFLLLSWKLAPSWKRMLLNEEPLFPYAYVLSAILVIALFACLLIHEFSHALMANKIGFPVRRIILFFLGGVAKIEKEPERPDQEFKITIVGPLASFGLAVLFYLLLNLMMMANLNKPILFAYFGWLFSINLIWVIFNLLPAFPLDGGRILRSILLYFLKDKIKATKITVNIGRVIAGLIIVWGFIMLGNFWFLIIGLFIIITSSGELQRLKMQK